MTGYSARAATQRRVSEAGVVLDRIAGLSFDVSARDMLGLARSHADYRSGPAVGPLRPVEWACPRQRSLDPRTIAARLI